MRLWAWLPPVSDDPIIPPPDPLIGSTVGDYQVIEPIGEGGMGVVYRGIQPVIKKRVAIKVLKPQVAGDEQQVRRLIAEAESVNAIGHRGIIDIFGLGTLPDGRPYIVMEFLEGEPLDVWLQQPARRPRAAASPRSSCCSRSARRSRPRTGPTSSTATSSRRTSSSAARPTAPGS